MAPSCALPRPRQTPYPENDLVNARWFPAEGNRAVIVLPHWNANGIAYNALGSYPESLLGFPCLRVSKPYHDIRRPLETARSDYAVLAQHLPHARRRAPSRGGRSRLPRLALLSRQGPCGKSWAPAWDRAIHFLLPHTIRG